MRPNQLFVQYRDDDTGELRYGALQDNGVLWLMEGPRDQRFEVTVRDVLDHQPHHPADMLLPHPVVGA